MTTMMMTQTLIVAPWFGVSASLSLTLHLPQCWRLSVCPESKPGHPQSPEFWGPPGPCPPLLSFPPFPFTGRFSFVSPLVGSPPSQAWFLFHFIFI